MFSNVGHINNQENIDLTLPRFARLAKYLRKLRSIIILENKNTSDIVYNIDNLLSVLSSGYAGDTDHLVNSFIGGVPISTLYGVCSEKNMNTVTEIYEKIIRYGRYDDRY